MYNKQIEQLRLIIENFDYLGSAEYSDFVRLGDVIINITDGLCGNASLKYLHLNVFNKIILSWKLFNLENGFDYFIDGWYEFSMCENLYQNPRRLDFAKHALNYLENLQEVQNV